ncbi:TetR/AcrR family transcriptional regulator [Massilia sp. BSC265]|uniref:TetR/AcrR family transcriptional regulator n=1 Tax=Massilia sp. BSC265 TaxID=1549812 RepID=UPI0004E9192F|nr:TetR/AcrR family transcriptional regulator [Massilia sp. BSC265]KFI06082.1 TetR family transcriptional regulator [Massilia sp. BSC265]
MQCPLDSKPRWERRKDARPQELLAAAIDLFVEHGFAATRLEDVARRAGVSKGTLYLYYTNKDELFKAVVRESILPFLGKAELSVAEFDGHSADLLRSVVMNWSRQIGQSKASGLGKLMLAEAVNFPELATFYREEVMSRTVQMISRIVERGVSRGEFRSVDIPRMTQVLIAPMMMLNVWRHSAVAPCDCSELQPQVFLENLLDLTLNGLLPRESA